MGRDGALDFAQSTRSRVSAIYTALRSGWCQLLEILALRVATQRRQSDMIVASSTNDVCTACVLKVLLHSFLVGTVELDVGGCYGCRSPLQGLRTNCSTTAHGSGAKIPCFAPFKNPASICAGTHVYNSLVKMKLRQTHESNGKKVQKDTPLYGRS